MGEAVIPLPNPGEGGPVYPGNMNNGVTDPGQIPVIPLPNPGEGGPVYPGPDGGVVEPVIPQIGRASCRERVCLSV